MYVFFPFLSYSAAVVLEIDVIVAPGSLETWSHFKWNYIVRCGEDNQYNHSKLWHIIPIVFFHIPTTNRTCLVLKLGS